MRLLAFIFVLSTQTASADELDLFKESAAKILVERTLGGTEKDAYVCISIEGKAPSAAQMTVFAGLGIRDVGPPSECECLKGTVEDKCFRTNSKRPACFVSVNNFQFHAFTNASASVIQSCGETNGRGDNAKFEKHEGVWVYAGSSGGVVL
jgi:hypothetical protein